MIYTCTKHEFSTDSTQEILDHIENTARDCVIREKRIV